MSETIIGGESKVPEIKKIKCFILSSGTSVITEYYEGKVSAMGGDEVDEELYWVNPMLSDFMKLPNGQRGLAMAALNVFNTEEVVGPINVLSILTSYDISDRYKQIYSDQVVKLKAQRLGLVPGTRMPKKPLKMGEGLKLQK